MSGYVKKVYNLPGAARTAEVLLHQTIEKLPRIKAITMVIQWDDETYAGDWSSQKVSELCMASRVLDLEVGKIVSGEGE